MLLRNERQALDYVRTRCSVTAFQQLEIFELELRKEAANQNLVAKSSLQHMWLRHIADSAQLLEHVSRETGVWLDIGSGGGFPGIVIAIMQPAVDVVMVEPRKLRVRWLQSMVSLLSLGNCRVEATEIQRVDPFNADVISARAFASMPHILNVTAPFSTNETEWVLPKGRSAAQDVAQLPASLAKRFHVKQSVTDADAWIVIGHGAMESDA